MADVQTPLGEALHRLLPQIGGDVDGLDGGAIDLEAANAALPSADPIGAGRNALRRVAADGPEAKLAPEEIIGGEAIIALSGRPALKVQDGRFATPPSLWSVLEEHRTVIEQRLSSVGRIELAKLPSIALVGTAFQVGPDVLLTNRHVAEIIASSDSGEWQFRPNLGSRVDYRAESPPATPLEHPLHAVIGVHTGKHVDLALLRMKPEGDAPVPEPLPIASTYEVEPGTDVYVIGHPAFDEGGSAEHQDIQRVVFEDLFDVKRVAPGKVLGSEVEGLTYDSSTLGGNSGSCVIDLATGLVVGLHYGGTYLKANYAVRLWEMRDDPIMRDVEINFV